VARDWWARTILVLQRPSAVFAALRADDDDERQEPLLAIVLLAGIAAVLSTNLASRLLDDFEIDALVLAVWAFLAGGIYGGFAYFALGALVYAGARAVGGVVTYRRARHVLGFAVVPLAVSLLIWPVRIAIYGDDLFRSGGSDTGTGARVFEALELAFIGWSGVLLVVGLRAYSAWSWPRAVLASLPVLAVVALVLGRAFGLF
jgi:Yip1 domain